MLEPKNIKFYLKDGRKSLFDLQAGYDRLVDEYGWNKKLIYSQDVSIDGERYTFPSFVYFTKTSGPAIWLISGVHGEEPAGPNAIFESVDFLGKLSEKGYSIVLIPLCNPSGYSRNWRYPNEYRDENKGYSVGNSAYLLPDLKNPLKPREDKPSSNEAKMLTETILSFCPNYPPIFSIDLHEDEALSEAYVYSQGKLGAKDPVAKKIVNILKISDMPLKENGKTRFGEVVKGGIISNVHDSSIDELLSSEKIFADGNVISGQSVKSVIVSETPTKGVELSRRAAVHKNIVNSIEDLVKIAKEG